MTAHFILNSRFPEAPYSATCWMMDKIHVIHHQHKYMARCFRTISNLLVLINVPDTYENHTRRAPGSTVFYVVLMWCNGMIWYDMIWYWYWYYVIYDVILCDIVQYCRLPSCMYNIVFNNRCHRCRRIENNINKEKMAPVHISKKVQIFQDTLLL